MRPPSPTRFIPAPLALAVALGLSMPALAGAQAEADTDKPVAFSIAAQPLGDALNELAAAAGLPIAFPQSLVAGKQAPAVKGTLTPTQALAQLLAGSGLQAQQEGGTVVIRAATTQETSMTLPVVKVTAQGARDGTTEGTGSYTTRALTLGKMPQSIRETPQSVTVVTRQQMDDQNLSAVEGVIAQTTGASKSQRNYGAHVYTIRGFEIPDSNYLLDGVGNGVYSPTGWVPMDTAILDRVEVLRGAAALVVGSGDPSGVVNLVRKRPSAEKHLSVAQSIGSWSNYRTELDAGGPLNDAATVRGRVVAAYTDRKYFYDLAHNRTPMLYGVLDADLGRRTKATLGYRHEQVSIDGYAIFGLPSFSTGASLGLPRSTSLGQSWNRHKAKVDDVFGELEHRLDGDWVGKLTVNRSQTSIVQKLGMARGAVDPATLAGLRFTGVEFTDRDIGATGLDANVTGSFSAWGGLHKVLFGASWSKQDVRTLTATLSQSIPVDVYNFNHDLIPDPATPAYDFGLQERTTKKGLYGSTRLQLAEPLFLHLGGRLNWYQYRSTDRFTGDLNGDYGQNGQLTPYAGLVYDINRQWSAYASYADTFEPQSQYQSIDGKTLKPAIGANVEAGVKGELVDQRLNVAFSVFSIRKRDVAVYDEPNAGLCPSVNTNDCYRNASLLRSKGFDAEIAGQLARGWEIATGYTKLRTSDGEGGSISSDTPRNLLRLSSSYTLPGDWSAWTVGANLAAQSRATVDVVQNPGHAVLDLRAGYRLNDHWTAALAVNNVFDRAYWAAIGGTRNGAYYGAPRNAMLTLRASY